jgi:GH25 family lysozyme M1 (1,4-beta-N-acetylmuramidase)
MKNILKTVSIFIMSMMLITSISFADDVGQAEVIGQAEILVNEALNDPSFGRYNVAVAQIMKIQDQDEKERLQIKLAAIGVVVFNQKINSYLGDIITLSQTASGKLYDELEARLRNSDLYYIDREYLLGELTSWGKRLVYTDDYKAAVDSVVNGWQSLGTSNIQTAIQDAENNISFVKNQLSKDYLTEQLNQIKAKAQASIPQENRILKGIDISVHNGDINFDTVKKAGVDVVIMKATEGVDYIDPYLEKNYNKLKDKGLNIGFYHFMSEKTDPAQQAEDFYNAIKDKNYNVTPILDVETDKQNRNSKELTDRVLSFLKRFEELSGYKCIIYTNPYFANDNLDSRLQGYQCWIAHYGVTTPMKTNIWASNYVGHQYTDNGQVNGINGAVNLSNFTQSILKK